MSGRNLIRMVSAGLCCAAMTQWALRTPRVEVSRLASGIAGGEQELTIPVEIIETGKAPAVREIRVGR